MRIATWYRSWISASALALTTLLGCGSDTESNSDNITDVEQTDVERQSIGNCWLYATASWAESLNLKATGTPYDISQSYWTYWHWYDQIIDERVDAIETGGNENVSFDIIQRRGIMPEAEFIAEDTTSEMSARQSAALTKMDQELKSGRLKSPSSRTNRKLVLQVLNEAWGLSPDVQAQLASAFGTTGKRTFLTSASVTGTKIVRAKDFPVRYTERLTDPNVPTEKTTTLKVAAQEWETAFYPSSTGSRRSFQTRVQQALHDRNPVVITWSVDFNAMAGASDPKPGSFNLDTLAKSGAPGRQGGHMTVLEDYEAVTEEFGVLKAGVTLDPTLPEDQAKLEAALLPTTTISFWRIKNSWGALRDDRASAPGFPGYHDLYQTYLNGPITWCPSVEGTKTASNCKGSEVPWENVVLPPGY